MKIREDNLHIKMFTAIDVINNNNLFLFRNRFVRRLSEHEHEWIKERVMKIITKDIKTIKDLRKYVNL
mgnify:CR=1 FL=1